MKQHPYMMYDQQTGELSYLNQEGVLINPGEAGYGGLMPNDAENPDQTNWQQ